MKHKVALATKHGKLAQIKPAFERLDDFELVLAEIDTDLFGTFSGETPRTASPLETAIAKAKAGAEALGLGYGLASEGSISPDPQLPWTTIDHEVVAFVSLVDDLVIYETHASTNIRAKVIELNSLEDFERQLEGFGMPSHAVNLFYSNADQKGLEKGIHNPDLLRTLAQKRLEQGYRVKIESDFRAMSSPSRQANILACAQKLATRLGSRCPSCDCIGWGSLSYEFGVACSLCGEKNMRVAHSEKLSCVKCDHFEVRSLNVSSIDPARCDWCNP